MLVHGISTHSFIWRNVFSELARQFDVIAIDLLGCGESDKPLTISYSLKNHSKIILEFLDNLDIEKVHFISHDVGGGIGQIFAVNYPERLHDLIMVNTVAYDYWPVQPIVAMRTPILRQLAMATLDYGALKLIVKRGLYYKEKLTSELIDLFWKPLRTKEGRKAFLHFAKSLNNQDLLEISDKICELTLPVLIIRGDADVYLSLSISQKLNENIPESQLARIPDGGHLIQEDNPEALLRHLLAFLEKD